MALVNSTKHTQKKPRLSERTDRPGSVAFYDIRPGNGAGLFFQPEAHKAPGCRSPHGAFLLTTSWILFND